jgi:snurportin-1
LNEFKVKHKDFDHKRRCEKRIEAQRDNRTNRFSAARNCDSDEDENAEDGDGSAGAGGVHGKAAAADSDGTTMDAADAMGTAAAAGGAKGKGKRRRQYADQLMLSEWMKVLPVDLADAWRFMLCPEGKRCLVVASKGETKAYGRNGTRINCFPSRLPGGARRQRPSARDYCILDCVFDKGAKTFYVLDMMCWGGHEVFDSDCEFRSYWLESKFEEEPAVMDHGKGNPYAFRPLPLISCTPAAIADAVGKPYPYAVDGLLFYHTQGHYTPGETHGALSFLDGSGVARGGVLLGSTHVIGLQASMGAIQ